VWRRYKAWPLGTKLIALTVPAIILLAALFALVLNLQTKAKLQEKLIHLARSLHTQIMADRQYYASVIVPRLEELGATLAPDYRNVHKAFPLPATFVREVSEATAQAGPDHYSANLISPWAINKDKGLKDQFQREAFAYLTAHPNGEFAAPDVQNGKSVMRVVMADVASAQSCVSCHNSHPLSPKRDFKLNDVMGGLEIIIPMDQYLAENRRDFVMVWSGAATLCLLIVGLVVMGTRQVVSRRLGVLQARMRTFAGDKRALSRIPQDVDEVTALAETFDEMEALITAQQRELQETNLSLEQRVADRTKALAAAGAEIQQKNRDLQTLLYVTSHDLREPLRSIENFSRFVLEGYADRLDDEGRDSLQRVVRAAHRLDTLLLDILTLSRAKRLELTLEDIPGDVLVGEALRRLEGKIEETKARVQVAKELPTLKVDKIWATQAVYNLIANALKFTQGGAAPEIEIGPYASEPGSEVAGLVVRDRGHGVPAGQEDRIFGLFHRAVGREVEGTGAGLAIVREVARRHGGEAWVRAREGGGSEFIITFGRTGPQEGDTDGRTTGGAAARRG
jgi:signal transduction histidine kinase